MIAFKSIGVSLPDLEESRLNSERARRTLSACRSTKAFKLVELRRSEPGAQVPFDVLVVDCINDQVPTRNSFGIMPRERLALRFYEDDSIPPEVRALRSDFPAVAHLNYADVGQPAWLCLYAEKWERVRLTWTPQKHLQAILSWLTGTSVGTLHQRDQPVEQIYFEPPIDLVLPPDFDDRMEKEGNSLALASVERTPTRQTLRSEFATSGGSQDNVKFVTLVLSLDPVVQGRIEWPPNTLGALAEQLQKRGTSLIEKLRETIKSRVSSNGIASPQHQMCLLILRIPIQREAGAAPERREHRGFVLPVSLASLGKAVGVLHREEKKNLYYAIPLIGVVPKEPNQAEWHNIQLDLVDIKPAATRSFARRASGCPDTGAEAPRVLAGVGALGSALAELWSREGWGRWTFVDADHIQPHNVVRHLSRDADVGFYKADTVKALTDRVYQDGDVSRAIRDTVLNQENRELQKSLQNAVLVVDATTTLEAPRELSQQAIARTVSVFLNPRGSDSVLLLEDEGRTLRLDALEAQYYAALLRNDWGEDHLVRDATSITVGAGCRDVSFVLSMEDVALHAAILAKRVRDLSAAKAARVCVWRALADGAVAFFDVPVATARIETISGWRVVSHADVEAKMISLRQENLPKETGGVILGYVDHQLKSIFIVDVLSAPPDSEAAATGFVRGVSGLEDAVAHAVKRTASIVGYIGEWHSHPPFHSADPSGEDRLLLRHLAEVLMRDGEPALMVIVGSANELSFSVRGGL